MLLLLFQCSYQPGFDKKMIYQNWFYPTNGTNYLSYSSVIWRQGIYFRNPQSSITHQPQISADKACVAEIFPGTRDFARRWIMVPCNETFNMTTVICERSTDNATEFDRKSVMDKLMQRAQFLDNQLTTDEEFCRHGWHYDNKCYELAAWGTENTCKEHISIDPNTVVMFHVMLPLYESVQSMQNELFYCVNNTQQLSLSEVSGLLRCSDGTYIAQHHACDGTADCPDASDESTCSHVCSFHNKSDGDCYTMCAAEHCVCHPLYFQCAGSGGCVALSKFCNSLIDCADGSDEKLCSMNVMKPRHGIEKGNYTCISGDIISMKLVNDTVPDCPQYGDDEVWLSGDTASIEITEDSIMLACIPGHPKLFSHQHACTLTWQANGHIAPCRNGGHLQRCMYHSCPHQYKCPFSYCIPTQAVCDGRVDCTDGSDERNCTNISCPNLLKCKQEGACIHSVDINDGVYNCPLSHDDEVMGISRCPMTCECKGTAVICHSFSNSITEAIVQATALVLRTNTNEQGANFLHLKVLKYLDVSHSHLDNRLHFSHLKSLLMLCIVNVTMHVIPTRHFHALVSLLELTLTHNNMVSIMSKAFSGLVSLITLDLSQQKLSHIATCALQDISSLKYLNLSFNKLTELSLFICGENTLNVLNLLGNNIVYFDPVLLSMLRQLSTLYSEVEGICCSAHIPTCTPQINDQFASCRNIISNKVLEYLAWVFGLLILIENIFAVIFYRINESLTIKKIIHRLFATSLNVSDMLMGGYLVFLPLFNLLYAGDFTMIQYVWKKSLQCKALALVSHISLQMSLFMTVTLCIERFIGICFPMNSTFYRFIYRVRISRILVACGAIVSSIIAASPIVYLYVQDKPIDNALCVMMLNFNYLPLGHIIPNVLLNSFLTLANIIMYTAIVVSVFTHKTKLGQRSNKKSMNITITLRIVCTVFTNSTCWLLVVIMGTLTHTGMIIDPHAFAICVLSVLPVGPMLNPILNLFTTQRFVTMFGGKGKQ